MEITTVDGIPVFSTVEQAIEWGLQFGLTNYHTHTWYGPVEVQVGYMAGANHSEATAAVSGGISVSSTPSTPTTTSGSSGGTSGGY